MNRFITMTIVTLVLYNLGFEMLSLGVYVLGVLWWDGAFDQVRREL